MTTSEKVAYLKGLAEGLALDSNSTEGKLFKTIIDILEDIALDLEDLNDNALDLADEIDELSDDLAAVEDAVYDDDDDDEDEDEDEDEDDYDYDGAMYDVECPYCHEEITVDEGVLECGALKCPHCGDVFTLDYEEAGDECGGGCDCCDACKEEEEDKDED